MRRLSGLAAGAMILIGVVWILQGLDLLGGSAMSGDSFWAWVGGIVLAAGIALTVRNVRSGSGGPK
jgi:hypothetical protein